MISPDKRRQAVEQVQAVMDVSERRVCRVLGQPRSTQRYQKRVAEDEESLTTRMVALASEYGRYGYRRITAMLHQEGWRVNHKRVERLWRREGLKVACQTAQTWSFVAQRRFDRTPENRVSQTCLEL